MGLIGDGYQFHPCSFVNNMQIASSTSCQVTVETLEIWSVVATGVSSTTLNKCCGNDCLCLHHSLAGIRLFGGLSIHPFHLSLFLYLFSSIKFLEPNGKLTLDQKKIRSNLNFTLKITNFFKMMLP